MGERGPDSEITPEDIVSLFRDREDSCEPLTASEVADKLDCARRTAHKWLNIAEEETTIQSKKVGGRARIWWLPE